MRAFLLLCLAVASGSAQTVLVHVNVFDGMRLLRNQSVVVENGIVTGIGAKATRPPGGKIIECKGKTVLPLLIDSASIDDGKWVQLLYDDGFAWGTRKPQASLEALHDEIEKVHKEHKKAVVEVGSLRESTEALNAEADGLLHIFAGAQSDALFIKQAVRRRVFIIPMLAALEAAALAKAGKPRREGSIEALKQLHAAHLPLLVGGPDLPLELEVLVRDVGLSPIDALQAATSLPARIFGLTGRGTIAKGTRAKLLVVNGDPSLSVSVLKKAEIRVF